MGKKPWSSMNTKKQCLCLAQGPEDMYPDFYPVSLKQAKKFLKQACIGHTNVKQLTGLRFRLKLLSQEERDAFTVYGNNICNNTLKRWNLKK